MKKFDRKIAADIILYSAWFGLLTGLVEGRPVEFLIDGADGVQLRGFGADSIELNCGALTSVPVRLEYRTDDTQSPPRRVLRSLELIKGQ